MLVMVTDLLSRKSFDLANILRSRGIDFILCDDLPGMRRRLLGAIYGKPVEKLGRGDSFGSDMLKITHKYRDRALIYIPIEEDTTLDFYAFIEQHGEIGNLHYNLPPKERFMLVRDKERFSRFCEEEGLPVPRRYDYETLARLKHLPCDLILKPRIGSGSVGIVHLEPGESLPKEAREMLIQERLPDASAVEGGFFLFSEGKIVGYHGHRRLRTYPESGGVTVYSRCEINPKLRELGERLLQKLEWSGLAMVEFLYDARSDSYRIIEVNPRLWGSLMLSEFCGSEIISNYCASAIGEALRTGTPSKDRYIRWFFPWDLLLYLKSGAGIERFWHFERARTCYINFSYTRWPRAIAFMLLNLFSPEKLRRLMIKMRQ